MSVFKRNEKILDYPAKVRCPLCGLRFNDLTSHLMRKHAMTGKSIRDYMKQYGYRDFKILSRSVYVFKIENLKKARKVVFEKVYKRYAKIRKIRERWKEYGHPRSTEFFCKVCGSIIKNRRSILYCSEECMRQSNIYRILERGDRVFLSASRKFGNLGNEERGS